MPQPRAPSGCSGPGLAFQPNKRTKALWLLLRVCLRSSLRREPGRFAGRPPWRSQRRIPIPARIAPRGGERACRRCEYCRECCRGCFLPPQEESDSGNMSGRLTSPGMGTLPHQHCACLHGLPDGYFPTQHLLTQQRRNTQLAAFLRTFLR